MKITVRKLRTGIFLSLLSVLLSFPFSLPAQAQEREEKREEDFSQKYVEQWLETIDMGAVNEGVKELFPELSIDGTRLLRMIMQGEVKEAAAMLAEQVKNETTGKILGMKQIFISILVLGILSALFSEFSDLFAGRQLAQAGFYFLYLFLLVVLTKVFGSACEVAEETVENIVLFIKMFIPTYFIAVGTAQGTATAACYYQLMLAAVYLVESFLGAVLMPFISSYVLLALLNGVWVEEKLSLLLELMKKGIIMVLKLLLGAVTGFSLVQAVIVPIADGLKISAVKKAVMSIPGIGGVAEGVAELLLGAAVLLKNSLGVLLLVLLAGVCLMPVIQLLALTLTVKLAAAVAGIVSDKRLAGCADKVGEGCFLLLRCVFTCVALFFIVIAVIAYATTS